MSTFEEGMAVVRAIADEYGIDVTKLRGYASGRLQENWPEGHGISSSDVSHRLASLGNNEPDELRAQARMWRVIKESAEQSGRTEHETLERFRQLLAPIEED